MIIPIIERMIEYRTSGFIKDKTN